MSPKPVRNRLQEYVIKESVVLTVIVINAVVLFLDAFPTINAATIGALHWVDYGCMVFFVLEASIKISRAGFGGYWSSGWNKLDFMIVVGSLPLLASPFVDASLQNFSILLLLRLGRLLRFSRVMRFVPNAAAIWLGVVRSLKASVAVLLVLFVLNLILAMGANLLFGNEPGLQEHFGNPLLAF
ncbi:MAG: ion transporter, partial [Rhodothermales bacterium]